MGWLAGRWPLTPPCQSQILPGVVAFSRLWRPNLSPWTRKPAGQGHLRRPGEPHFHRCCRRQAQGETWDWQQGRWTVSETLKGQHCRVIKGTKTPRIFGIREEEKNGTEENAFLFPMSADAFGFVQSSQLQVHFGRSGGVPRGDCPGRRRMLGAGEGASQPNPVHPRAVLRAGAPVPEPVGGGCLGGRPARLSQPLCPSRTHGSALCSCLRSTSNFCGPRGRAGPWDEHISAPTPPGTATAHGGGGRGPAGGRAGAGASTSAFSCGRL